MDHFKWFLVVFFSLTLTFISTGSFFKLWVEYDVYQAQLAFEAAQKEIALILKNERLKNERIDMVNSKKRKEEQRELSSKRSSELSALETNRQTCKFWRTQYQKTKTEHAKNYMDSSCLRASKIIF